MSTQMFEKILRESINLDYEKDFSKILFFIPMIPQHIVYVNIFNHNPKKNKMQKLCGFLFGKTEQPENKFFYGDTLTFYRHLV